LKNLLHWPHYLSRQISVIFMLIPLAYNEISSIQGWFCLENKITENQWTIDETIYIPFQMVCFFTCSESLANFGNFSPEENGWNQLNNWRNIIPDYWNKGCIYVFIWSPEQKYYSNWLSFIKKIKYSFVELMKTRTAHKKKHNYLWSNGT
jgi:hypothetical protein